MNAGANRASIGRRIAISAVLIMLGNIVSRLLGLVREQTIAALFGTTAAASLFSAVSRVPTMVYDLLIGGAISAALVPIFSEIAAKDSDEANSGKHTSGAANDELKTVAGCVIGLTLAVLVPVVVALMVFAPSLMSVLGVGFAPEVQEQGILLTRVALPSVIFLGVAAVLMAVHYAQHRVTFPSFAAGVYNLGIIVSAVSLSVPFGVTGLVIGLLVGAGAQMVLQFFGLRGALPSVTLNAARALREPAVRRILRLYAPGAAGLAVSAAVVVLDTRLASQTGEGSLAAMRYATNLVQLPLGLVATALSFAVLPVLSRHGKAGAHDPEFGRTLSLGMRAALLLIAPATVALIVLREPVIRLIFQRGSFGPEAVDLTSLALLYYSPQLPFVALDQLLIAAFYALQNTRLPVLIGVVGAALYTVVAVLTVEPLGMPGLVLANTLQNSAHAVILFLFLLRLPAIRGTAGLAPATLRIGFAALSMAAILLLFQEFIAIPNHALGLATYLAASLAVAGASYLMALVIMRSEELSYATRIVTSRLRRRSQVYA
ncbi:MAG TPA: murein biosynthesis integral membrane protein MurJ [Chloroflexota bacterium]|nr:murein biosynthesis integral membrane protein MurJ [Chloroflexota bacterium]